MENAWRSRKSCSKLVLQPRYLNKLRGDLPSPKISRLLGGWRNKMQKMRKGVGFVWNTVLTTGCCLQLDDNCPGCLILLSGKIWDVDRYMTGVATVDKHIWKKHIPRFFCADSRPFFSSAFCLLEWFPIHTASHSIGNAWGAFLTTTLHICSQWFHASTKKKLASKASKLKTPPPTRATRKDLQLPAARILKLNCPKKKNSSLQRWNWVPLAQGRSCLSLCNQHLYWPVRNPEARKQLLRTIQRAAGWDIYYSEADCNRIKSPKVFAIQTESKDCPGCPSCRIQAWSTIIQVYLDLLPQVTIVVTTWDY